VLLFTLVLEAERWSQTHTAVVLLFTLLLEAERWSQTHTAVVLLFTLVLEAERWSQIAQSLIHRAYSQGEHQPLASARSLALKGTHPSCHH